MSNYLCFVLKINIVYLYEILTTTRNILLPAFGTNTISNSNIHLYKNDDVAYGGELLINDINGKYKYDYVTCTLYTIYR